MAKEYVTKVSSFGHLKNRDAVEQAAMEGRVIPPLVDYLPEGSKVRLSEDHAERFVRSGAIEEPGASQKQRKALLEQEQARLDAELAQLASESPDSFDVESAKKPALEDEVKRLGLDVQGSGKDGAVTVDDLRDALRAHQSQQG